MYIAFGLNSVLEESLDKAKSQSKHLEWKAREGMKKMKGAEEERDRAKEEAQVARLVAVAAGDVKAWVKEAQGLRIQWLSSI